MNFRSEECIFRYSGALLLVIREKTDQPKQEKLFVGVSTSMISSKSERDRAKIFERNSHRCCQRNPAGIGWEENNVYIECFFWKNWSTSFDFSVATLVQGVGFSWHAVGVAGGGRGVVVSSRPQPDLPSRRRGARSGHRVRQRRLLARGLPAGG